LAFTSGGTHSTFGPCSPSTSATFSGVSVSPATSDAIASTLADFFVFNSRVNFAIRVGSTNAASTSGQGSLAFSSLVIVISRPILLLAPVLAFVPVVGRQRLLRLGCLGFAANLQAAPIHAHHRQRRCRHVRRLALPLHQRQTPVFLDLRIALGAAVGPDPLRHTLDLLGVDLQVEVVLQIVAPLRERRHSWSRHAPPWPEASG